MYDIQLADSTTVANRDRSGPIGDGCQTSSDACGYLPPLVRMELASQTPAVVTRGNIKDEILSDPTTRIRIDFNMSELIVETKKQYTAEEMTSSSIQEVIDRRLRSISTVCPANAAALAQPLKTVRDESLPIVVELDEFNFKHPIISCLVKGSQQNIQILRELVDFRHLDPADWEVDRVNLLSLEPDVLAGVYYTNLDFLDIVYTPKTVANLCNRQNLIFRLKGVYFNILSSLQIHEDTTVDSRDSGITLSSHIHPSLINADIIRKSKRELGIVSHSFVPGSASWINGPITLPNRYFISGEGFLTCKKLEDTIPTFSNKSPSTVVKSDQEPYKTVIAKYKDLVTRKDNLDDIVLSTHEFRTASKALDAANNTSVNNTVSTTAANPFKDITSIPHFERMIMDHSVRVKCFLMMGNIEPVNQAVIDSNNKLAVVIPLRNERDRPLTTVAVNFTGKTRDVFSVHLSGRFWKNGFIPDISEKDLSSLLLNLNSSATSKKTLEESSKILTHVLFHNNFSVVVDKHHSFEEVLRNGFLSLVESSTTQQLFIGEFARSIGTVFDMVSDVLFVSPEQLEMKRADQRVYEWSCPVVLPLLLYNSVVKQIASDKERAETEFSQVAARLVLEMLIEPFLDAVVETGAWAVYDVRHLLDEVVTKKFVDIVWPLARQDTRHSLGRVIATIHFIEEAARHQGMCSISKTGSTTLPYFNAETDFFIEPGLPFSRHVMSAIPSRIFDKSKPNVGDALLELLERAGELRINQDPNREKTSTQQKYDAKFSLSLPDDILNGSVNVIIRDPSTCEGSSPPYGASQSWNDAAEKTIVYHFPKALTLKPSKYSDGFFCLKNRGLLTSHLEIIDKPRRLGLNFSERDNVFRAGLSMDVVWGTGQARQTITDDKATLFNLKGGEEFPSYYTVKEFDDTEVVFWDPLISSFRLLNDAKEKEITDPSQAWLNHIFEFLNLGNIDIFPKGNSSKSFEHLWLRLVRQFRRPMPPSTEALPPYNNRHIKESKSNFLHFVITKFGNSDTVKRNLKTLDSAFKYTRDPTFNNPSSAVEPPSVAAKAFSVQEHSVFLQQHFAKILTLLLTRIMAVVTKNELKTIQNVSSAITDIVINSLKIATDPSPRNVSDILQRVAIESNSSGVFVDEKGALHSLSNESNVVSLLADSTTGLSTEAEDFARDASINDIINGLTPSNNTNNRNSQRTTKNIATAFSTKLAGLIREDQSNAISNKSRLQQMNNKPINHILTSMPAPLPGNRFTQASLIYVPFNPRRVFTDIQWMEIMSSIERKTRAKLSGLQQFNATYKDINDSIQELLQKWQSVVLNSSDAVERYISSFDQLAAMLSKRRDIAAANIGFLSGHYYTVHLPNYKTVALVRSLIDIHFLLEVPNFWFDDNWPGLIETCVEIALNTLKTGITKGNLIAQRGLRQQQALKFAEKAEAILHYSM